MKKKLLLLAAVVLLTGRLSAHTTDSNSFEWYYDEFDEEDLFGDIKTDSCYLLIAAKMDSLFDIANDFLSTKQDLKALGRFDMIIRLYEGIAIRVECGILATYMKELYIWSLYQQACIFYNPQRNMNDSVRAVGRYEKIVENWIDSSDAFYSNTIQMERNASRYLSTIYYNRAIKKQNPSEYFDTLMLAIKCYNKAEVRFTSVEDILNIDYIEWAFRAVNDTVSINHRNDLIGEFFYNHHSKLYKGLDNIIEMPGMDSKRWDTVPYAVYPLIWLTKQGRYEDALRYYDSIEDRFQNDIHIRLYRIISLLNLGYYGEELETMSGLAIASCKESKLYTKLYTDEERAHSRIWTNYTQGQYKKAIYYCRKVPEEKMTPWILLIRGICYDRLAGQTTDERWRDIYKNGAYDDYAAAINLGEDIGTPQDPFPYALLGRTQDAIRIAEHQKDSLKTADAYVSLAQIYCIAGDTVEAKRCLNKSLEKDHSIGQLSFILSLPYLSPLRKYLLSQIDERFSFQNGLTLKRLEADTIQAFLEYTEKVHVRIVSCNINGVEVDSMIFDSGAEMIQITKKIESRMRENGTLTDDDFLRNETFHGVGGDVEQPVYNFRTVTLGDTNCQYYIELHNVTGTVAKSDNALLLLGQSVLSNFIVEMNPHEHLLTLQRIKYKR